MIYDLPLEEIVRAEGDKRVISGSFKSGLGKYATFSGRARRSEYWYWTLASILVLLACYAVLAVSETFGPVFVVAFYLAILLPSIAVSVRRLHDPGRSGWWVLLALVPLASIVLLVFMCLDSEPRPTAYGPSPKEASDGYDGAGGYTRSPSNSTI